MKKTILFFIVIITTIFLSGCGKQPTVTPDLVNTANSNQTVNITNSSSDTSGPAEKNITIVIKDFKFEPEIVTIKDGAIITWKNQDNASHQIISDQEPKDFYLPSIESYVLAPNQEWSYTFDGSGTLGPEWEEEYGGEGTFGYHCLLHPEMKGQIKVIK